MKLQELLHKKLGVILEANDVSALDTPRKAMTKIHQLAGTALRKFISDFKESLDSASFMVKTTPKVDGNAFRIAWIDGNVFIENSYSGMMGKEELQTQKIPDYQQKVFDCLDAQNKKPLFDFIKKFGLRGIKITGELLPNGADLTDDGKITYIGTTYDATKLGKYGSLVIFDVKGATMNELSDLTSDVSSKIKTFLASEFSDSDFSYFDINKFAQNIPISKSDFPSEFIEQLDSIQDVSKLNKTTAEEIRDKINSALTSIFKLKFKNPDIMPKGDQSLEGVAFELNGNLYGIHYQSWKDLKHSYFEDIDEVRDFVRLYLARMMGKPEGSLLSSLVSELRNNIDQWQPVWEEHWKDFIKKRKEVTDKVLADETRPNFIKKFGQEQAKSLIEKFKDEDITSDLKSLLNIIMPVKDMKGKTIAIIPGSFRPPHKGHFEMIRHYASIADEVYVAISGQATLAFRRPDKFGRTMPNYVAGQILKIYCDAYGLTNVKIQPVMKLMKWISWKLHSTSNAKVILGVSGKDDVSRFDAFTSKRFKSQVPTLEILPVEDYMPKAVSVDGEDVSATWVRQHIDDKEAIRKIVPDKLSKEEFEKAFELMNPPSGEYTGMVNKAIADTLFVPESIRLNEGGNAVSDVVRINQENVADTLDSIYKNILSKLGITKDMTDTIGSTGRRLPGKSSGDIDILIDNSKFNANSFKDFADHVSTILDKLHIEYNVMHGFSTVSIKWPISNIDGKQENKFVQVDLMLTDSFEFTKFSKKSPQEIQGEPYYKMTIRNAILSALARVLDTKIYKTGMVKKDGELEEVPVDIERYSYDMSVGLNHIHKKRNIKKNGTYNSSWDKDSIIKKHITHDPQKIVDMLFGSGHMPKEIETVMGTWKLALKSPILKNPENKEEFLRGLKKDLNDKREKQNLEIPQEIETAMNSIKESKIISEVYKVFDNVERINQENVEATVKDFQKVFCKYTGVKPNAIKPLGSTGKKLPGNTSGDIDLGIDTSALNEQGYNLETKQDWFQFCREFSNSTNVKYHEFVQRGLTSVEWPIANKDGRQPNMYVQVDLIPHKNLKMLEWGMYQTPEEKGKDYDKSTVRALLLQAIAKEGLIEVLDVDDENNPIKIRRYEYKQNDGLFEIIREKHLKKNGTYTNWINVSKEKVTDDPTKIVDIIFGKGRYKPNDLLSVREVWDAFKKSDYWKNSEIKQNIQKDFEKKMDLFNVEKPKYIKFNESLNEDDGDEQDSKSRVAVIITDGKSVLTGQSPQSARTNGKFDLFKGHAKIDEDLKEAACREVKEECGLNLSESDLEQISGQIKYLSGTTITFFIYHLETLPSLKTLKCNSFYEYKGEYFPEIVAYHIVPIDELELTLYTSLVKAMKSGNIFEKLARLNESKELSIAKLSSILVESIINHKHNRNILFKDFNESKNNDKNNLRTMFEDKILKVLNIDSLLNPKPQEVARIPLKKIMPLEVAKDKIINILSLSKLKPETFGLQSNLFNLSNNRVIEYSVLNPPNNVSGKFTTIEITYNDVPYYITFSTNDNQGNAFEDTYVKEFTSKYKKPLEEILGYSFKLNGKPIPEGFKNQHRTLTLKNNQIKLDPDGIDTSKTVTDVTIPIIDKNGNESNIYLSLKYGPTVTLFNCGTNNNDIFPKKAFEENSNVDIGEIGNAILKMFGINKKRFIDIFRGFPVDRTKKRRKATYDIKKNPKSDIDKIKTFLLSAIGYDYVIIHQIGNKTYYHKLLTPKDAKAFIGNIDKITVQYPTDYSAKRVNVIVTTTTGIEFTINIRSKDGGIAPTHLMADYKINDR